MGGGSWGDKTWHFNQNGNHMVYVSLLIKWNHISNSGVKPTSFCNEVSPQHHSSSAVVDLWMYWSRKLKLKTQSHNPSNMPENIFASFILLCAIYELKKYTVYPEWHKRFILKCTIGLSAGTILCYSAFFIFFHNNRIVCLLITAVIWFEAHTAIQELGVGP